MHTAWRMVIGFALLMGIFAHGQAAFAQAAPVYGPPTTIGPFDENGSRVVTPSLLGTEGALVGKDAMTLNPLEILAAAGNQLPGVSGNANSSGSQSGGLSPAITVLLVLTIISIAPAILLMGTCFVRIIIVLGLLKQAMGTQSLPPPQVIVGLALFMTLMVMGPTFNRVYAEAVKPYRAGQIQSYDELWAKGSKPFRDFMFDQIEATGNWSSLYMMLRYQGVAVTETSIAEMSEDDVSITALVPAYMLSELKAGFLMGFKVYLPFLVIDIVIASLLISMSMMMLPPVLISLPFKLLLFVLVDGWMLVVGGLMKSFSTGTATDVAVLSSSLSNSLSHFVSGGFG